MSDIRVYRLPETTDPALLAIQSPPLRLARLKALQSEPKAWKSKYEDEIKQPAEFWLARLRPENAQHFVAEALPSNSSEEVVYKATLVVIAPDTPIEEHEMPTYRFAAVWVDTELRSQNVGTRMFEESVKWIREDASKNGWKQVRYELHVKPDNHRAINLYRRLGFLPASECDGEEDTNSEDYLSGMRMIIDIS